jgi:DNA-binding response OmpR family regulator
MGERRHVVIVDDEEEMRDAVEEYLTLRGHRVSGAADGKEMDDLLARDPADLVLVDLNLPGEDGIALTRRLRRASRVGIIIITAHGGAEDRVLGLESGSDDYIVKPFNLRELLARINSVLRRLSPDEQDTEPVDGPVQVGELTFDVMDGTLSRPDGSDVHVSTGEAELLSILVRNPDRAVSRDELLDQLAQRGWEPFTRSIDVRVARLRRKIEADPSRPRVIKTVRGVGYLFKSS